MGLFYTCFKKLVRTFLPARRKKTIPLRKIPTQTIPPYDIQRRTFPPFSHEKVCLQWYRTFRHCVCNYIIYLRPTKNWSKESRQKLTCVFQHNMKKNIALLWKSINIEIISWFVCISASYHIFLIKLFIDSVFPFYMGCLIQCAIDPSNHIFQCRLLLLNLNSSFFE